MEIKTNNKRVCKMGRRNFKFKVLALPMLVISCGGHTNKDRDPPAADSPKSQSTNEDPTNDANKSGDRPVSAPIGNAPQPQTPKVDRQETPQ